MGTTVWMPLVPRGSCVRGVFPQYGRVKGRKIIMRGSLWEGIGSIPSERINVVLMGLRLALVLRRPKMKQGHKVRTMTISPVPLEPWTMGFKFLAPWLAKNTPKVYSAQISSLAWPSVATELRLPAMIAAS